MTDTNELDAFKFAFDPMLDPMGGGMSEEEEDTPGPFTPNAEGRTEFLPPDPDRIPAIDHAVKQDTEEYASRPAIERTRQLFEQLKSQRSILVGMIEAARTPVTTDAIEQCVEELRERRFTMYSTANLCSMLETAGAFERVTEAGEPYDQVKVEPDIVVEDGEEYWVPSTPPKVCWTATSAAFEACDAANFQDKLEALFDEEAELLPIYKHVLTMASSEGGTTMSELSAAVDSNPLIAEPRTFFVQHFIEGLERCAAVEWNGSAWEATAFGKVTLGDLADVEDMYESDEQAKVGEVAAESDGIRW